MLNFYTKMRSYLAPRVSPEVLIKYLEHVHAYTCGHKGLSDVGTAVFSCQVPLLTKANRTAHPLPPLASPQSHHLTDTHTPAFTFHLPTHPAKQNSGTMLP